MMTHGIARHCNYTFDFLSVSSHITHCWEFRSATRVTNSIVVIAPNLFNFWHVREFFVEVYIAKEIVFTHATDRCQMQTIQLQQNKREKLWKSHVGGFHSKTANKHCFELLWRRFKVFNASLRSELSFIVRIIQNYWEMHHYFFCIESTLLASYDGRNLFGQGRPSRYRSLQVDHVRVEMHETWSCQVFCSLEGYCLFVSQIPCINVELIMECKLIAHLTWQMCAKKLFGITPLLAMKDQWDCVLNDFDELGGQKSVPEESQ